MRKPWRVCKRLGHSQKYSKASVSTGHGKKGAWIVAGEGFKKAEGLKGIMS